jgi:hypothetical protein
VAEYRVVFARSARRELEGLEAPVARRIISRVEALTTFLSLDGVMEAPGGGESYKHAGWTFKIDRGKEGDTFKLNETLNSEALLLGRGTYEGFAAAWSSRTNEFAGKFNSSAGRPRGVQNSV